jgi:hypothetical protein
MRGSHTPILPLQALSQPSNMGSRTIGACSQVFRFTFFQYTTITVAHSAYFSNVPLFPRPYTTTYLSRMLRLSRNRNPIPWVIQIRKLPCHLRLYLRIEYRLFPLPQCVGLFRCRFVAVTPVMVTQAIPSTMLHYFCLLTGIALCTSLGVCGR